MASSQPEGRLQLDHYPFRISGYLDRPSSYSNKLDTISNPSAGWIDAISDTLDIHRSQVFGIIYRFSRKLNTIKIIYQFLSSNDYLEDVIR
jgi:hypothetical protein